MSKFCLITGGSGFIGQRLVAALKQSGSEIRFLSRKYQFEDTVVCDLQSDFIPDAALDGIDTVFHLAGFAHDMRDASKIKDLYYRLNVDATVQLANLAVNSGVKRFVFVSSVKAGGNPLLGKCANEEDQRNTEDIYGKMIELSTKPFENLLL